MRALWIAVAFLPAYWGQWGSWLPDVARHAQVKPTAHTPTCGGAALPVLSLQRRNRAPRSRPLDRRRALRRPPNQPTLGTSASGRPYQSCYHQLRNWTSSDSRANRLSLICPPRYFRAHLDALAEDGWTTISPAQYLRHLTTGAALPPKPVMLSFDDGSAGQATEGLAQLVKRGMTGTFFVMTVVLGKPRWMSIRDLHRLAEAGMTIGSHTWDHRAVSDLAGRAWKVQFEQSRERCAKRAGSLLSTSPTRTGWSAPRRSRICQGRDTRPRSNWRPRGSI
jgi:Polysaccharide deacetylase